MEQIAVLVMGSMLDKTWHSGWYYGWFCRKKFQNCMVIEVNTRDLIPKAWGFLWSNKTFCFTWWGWRSYMTNAIVSYFDRSCRLLRSIIPNYFTQKIVGWFCNTSNIFQAMKVGIMKLGGVILIWHSLLFAQQSEQGGKNDPQTPFHIYDPGTRPPCVTVRSIWK